MNELTLGIHAKQRNFFEPDVVFFGDTFNTSKLIDAYEQASKKASKSASHAVSSGRLDDLRRAQWDTAVVKTLEQVLSSVKSSSDADGSVDQEDDIALPDAPSFDLS